MTGRMLTACLIAVIAGTGLGEARAAVVVRAPVAGPSVPAAGWAGVVGGLYSAVQSQALSNPGLLPLQSTLGEIDLRLSQDETIGLRSMEFVRFLPKKYQERPEAFARLEEGRQVAGLARSVRAAGRALDREVAGLSEAAASGEASDADMDRLSEILENGFYLSPNARERAREKLSKTPALARLHQILTRPAGLQGSAFDNAAPPAARRIERPASVVVPASQSPLRKPGRQALRPPRADKQGESRMNAKIETFSFPNIPVEKVPYPTVIMGEDAFTGWFGKGEFPSEDARGAAYQEAIETAYNNGVRGFSMSPHPTLMGVLQRFKKAHPDIIVIANPHYRSHYYAGKESLWTPANIGRLIATVAARVAEAVRSASPLLRDARTAEAFSDDEIVRFRLEEREYKEKLASFGTFADFVVVGNLPFGSLARTGREDIIRREAALVREAGLVPLGISEGGDDGAKTLKDLGVAGLWVWANRTGIFPSPADLAGFLRDSALPLTAFRIFEHDGGFDLPAALAAIRDSGRFSSILVGVDDRTQAKETFSRLRELLQD